MTNKQESRANLGDFLALVRQFNQETAKAVKITGELLTESVNDYICGSWVSCVGYLSVLVRKQPGFYEAILCDHDRGYRACRQVLRIAQVRGKLQVVDFSMQPTGYAVTFDAPKGFLTIEPFGKFEPEEKMILEDYYNQTEISYED